MRLKFEKLEALPTLPARSNRSLGVIHMPIIPIRPIRVVGNVAYVPLNNGLEAIIDASDAHIAEGTNWQISSNEKTKPKYAVRLTRTAGVTRNVALHRLIMSASDGMIVDHIDGNGLNNRRENLRFATHSENMRNRKISKKNKSGFKGVYFVQKKNNNWRALIEFNSTKYHLGYFETPELAYAAYVSASQKYHGEFGRV